MSWDDFKRSVDELNDHLNSLGDQSIDSCGLTAYEKARFAFKVVSSVKKAYNLYSGTKRMVRGIKAMT